MECLARVILQDRPRDVSEERVRTRKKKKRLESRGRGALESPVRPWKRKERHLTACMPEE